MVKLLPWSIKAKRDTGTTIPISRCRTLPSDLRHPDLSAILVKIKGRYNKNGTLERMPSYVKFCFRLLLSFLSLSLFCYIVHDRCSDEDRSVSTDYDTEDKSNSKTSDYFTTEDCDCKHCDESSEGSIHST